MSGLEGLFERGEPFPIEREHLMESILQTYSFEHWKIPIVENVDNFIDEKKYHTISFFTKRDELRIEMKGAGIPEETFNNLAKIAFTTKIDEFLREKKEGLGYFGWGLKATMVVAEQIEIETKCGPYRGRQVWYWKGRVPYYYTERPLLDVKEEQTILIYHLKEEFWGKIGEGEVVKVLQEFYPTLLAGAPALGRRRAFFVNDKRVPKPDWLDENNYREAVMLKDLKVAGESISGRVFISNEELPEEYRGLAVIVCGRCMSTRFNPFPEVKNYTGYVHADLFFRYLYSDKTGIRKWNNPRYSEFRKVLAGELGSILRARGLLPKTTVRDKEFSRRVHKVIAKVIREVPELEKYGLIGPMRETLHIYARGDEVPVVKASGPSSKTDIPHRGREKGVDQPGLGGKGALVSPSEEGEEKARRRTGRRRALPQFIITDELSEQIEALYEGGDRVMISKNHPLYQYAERSSESARYLHVCRAGLEALLDYLLKNGEIRMEKYLEIKRQVVYALGDAL